MNEEQSDISPEPVQEESRLSDQLTTVTPVSKYLAMALFIALPFVGGWVGYTYGPEKVVEVEKVVNTQSEKVSIADERDEDLLNDHASERWVEYIDDEAGIAFSYPETWSPIERSLERHKNVYFSNDEIELSGEVPEECSGIEDQDKSVCSGVTYKMSELGGESHVFLSFKGRLHAMPARGKFWGDLGTELINKEMIENLCELEEYQPTSIIGNMDSCEVIWSNEGVPIVKVVREDIEWSSNIDIDAEVRTIYFLFLDLNTTDGVLVLSPRRLIEQGDIPNAATDLERLVKSIRKIGSVYTEGGLAFGGNSINGLEEIDNYELNAIHETRNNLKQSHIDDVSDTEFLESCFSDREYFSIPNKLDTTTWKTLEVYPRERLNVLQSEGLEFKHPTNITIGDSSSGIYEIIYTAESGTKYSAGLVISLLSNDIVTLGGGWGTYTYNKFADEWYHDGFGKKVTCEVGDGYTSENGFRVYSTAKGEFGFSRVTDHIQVDTCYGDDHIAATTYRSSDLSNGSTELEKEEQTTFRDILRNMVNTTNYHCKG